MPTPEKGQPNNTPKTPKPPESAPTPASTPIPEPSLPALTFSLEDGDFEMLSEIGSLKIFDFQTQEKVEGDFERPEEAIKAGIKKITPQIHKDLQGEGFDPDHYKLEYFLYLGKNEDEIEEAGFIEEEDAIVVAISDLGNSEVNGFKNKYTLYLLGLAKIRK